MTIIFYVSIINNFYNKIINTITTYLNVNMTLIKWELNYFLHIMFTILKNTVVIFYS